MKISEFEWSDSLDKEREYLENIQTNARLDILGLDDKSKKETIDVKGILLYSLYNKDNYLRMGDYALALPSGFNRGTLYVNTEGYFFLVNSLETKGIKINEGGDVLGLINITSDILSNEITIGRQGLSII